MVTAARLYMNLRVGRVELKALNACLGVAVTEDPGRSGEVEKMEALEDVLLHTAEFFRPCRLAPGCGGLCPRGGEAEGLAGWAGVELGGWRRERSMEEGRMLGSVRLFHSPAPCVSVDSIAMLG